METIVINNKTFVISEHNDSCHKCLFSHYNNYPNSGSYCCKTKSADFIVIREANVIDKTRMLFKKKINK